MAVYAAIRWKINTRGVSIARTVVAQHGNPESFFLFPPVDQILSTYQRCLPGMLANQACREVECLAMNCRPTLRTRRLRLSIVWNPHRNKTVPAYRSSM